MNILISGSSGFLGSNLKEYLSIKRPEFNLFYLHKGTGNNQSEILWENISEKVEIKTDVIIHLAGKSHDTKHNSSKQEYYNTNVLLTKRIFQYYLKSQASKFIFLSSVKAVADFVPGYELTEKVLPNPKTNYGISKLEAEQYILSELQKWQNEEEVHGRDYKWKKIYILRPCMIHGPGNKGNLNQLFKLQLRGLPWPLGAFENKRSFCSVENILFVILQLIEKNIEQDIYQVADDRPLSTNEIIELIAENQNKKAVIWKVPVQIINIIALLGDFFHLPLNNERLMKLTESYIVSNQKIKQALGIDQMPVMAIDGIRKTLESFKEQTE